MQPNEILTKCPYCSETIQPDAKKCRFCGEWLVSRRAVPGETRQEPEIKYSTVEYHHTDYKPVPWWHAIVTFIVAFVGFMLIKYFFGI